MEAKREKQRRRERSAGSPSPVSFGDYLRTLGRRAERTARRFRLHFILSGAVNAFLVLINLFTGISFPWFLFPLAAGAMLLANHYALLRQHARQSVETGEFDELSPFQTDALRRLHRQRTAFSLSLTSAVSGALFLGMTNLIVSPDFAWAAITAGALGLGVLVHYLGYGSAKERLLERLGTHLPTGFLRAGGLLSISAARRGSRGARRGEPLAAEIQRARELKESIEARLEGVASVHGSLETEIAPLLDRYLGQIAKLIEGRDEISNLTARSVFAGLEAERARLVSLKEAARTPVLESEYRRAIAGLDGRLESLEKLREQREVAALRLGSALHSLEQLEVEVVRLRTQSDIDGSTVSEMVERKVEELSSYIADFEAGRRELEAQ